MEKYNKDSAKGEDYRTDSTYIYHYSEKLSPNYIRTALLLEGILLPDPKKDEPFRYLELGFGQGLSFLIHAAANPGEYWGADFQPEHAASAKNIADTANLNTTVLADSFAEMSEKAQSGQLPSFDVIAFHGVWSWINDENRQHILNIINHSLRPGGVVYVSYNAMPGWAFFMPVREIMVRLMERHAQDRNSKESVREVLDFIIAAAETEESSFFAFYPKCLSYLRSLKDEPIDYVAHEFFNSSWNNFYYHEVARDMASTGCAFAASAYVQYQSTGVTGPKMSQHIGQILNRDIRESMRDFVLDRKFRADYFVRSPIKADDNEISRRIRRIALKLPKDPADVKLEVNFGYHTISVEQSVFAPILERLNANNRSVKTVEEIFDNANSPDAHFFIRECLRILIGANAVRPAVESFTPETEEQCRNLNGELLRRIAEKDGPNIQFLASPALGAGVRLPRETLLALPGKIPPDLLSYRIPIPIK